MKHIGAPSEEMLLCGMSMGVEDTGAPINALISERTPAAKFATFIEVPE